MRTHTITITLVAPNRITSEQAADFVTRLVEIGKEDAAATLDDGEGDLREAKDALSLRFKTIGWAPHPAEQGEAP